MSLDQARFSAFYLRHGLKLTEGLESVPAQIEVWIKAGTSDTKLISLTQMFALWVLTGETFPDWATMENAALVSMQVVLDMHNLSMEKLEFLPDWTMRLAYLAGRPINPISLIGWRTRILFNASFHKILRPSPIQKAAHADFLQWYNGTVALLNTGVTPTPPGRAPVPPGGGAESKNNTGTTSDKRPPPVHPVQDLSKDDVKVGHALISEEEPLSPIEDLDLVHDPPGDISTVDWSWLESDDSDGHDILEEEDVSP